MLNAETKPKYLLSTLYKAKNFFYRKRVFLRKRVWKTEQKTKRRLLTALAAVIMKEPRTSIRKHTNELKVHEKTMRTVIKQDLSSDLNLLHYVIWGVLKNKPNATSHPNIGLFKEEWNKISEEFILKSCKSFRRHVDAIIEKNGGYIE